MTLPNFLIIGAAKSGTTAIYTYIKQHPQIFMSEQKELRFFSYTSEPIIKPPKDYIHPAITTLKEYQQHFTQVTDEIAIGESSPMYLYTPGTAERIKHHIPEVKLLAILRNPIQRAYSAYTHALREWKEPAGSFESALQQEDERIAAGWGMLWHYKKSGLYYQQLLPYYDIFNPEQIKVVLYDDLVANTNQLLQDIFKFLGVEPSFRPDTSSRPNVSGFPKNQFIHKLMKRIFIEDNPVKQISRRVFPEDFRKNVMPSLRRYNLEKRPMSHATKEYLIDYYKDEVTALGKFLNRDLSHWIKK